MTDVQQPSRFERMDARMAQLSDLARRLREGAPAHELLHEMNELIHEDRDAAPPTADDRATYLAHLARKHGEAPPRELLGQELRSMAALMGELHGSTAENLAPGLGLAVALGDARKVRRLIAKGANPNLSMGGGHSLLMVAAIARRRAVARELVAAGAHVSLIEAIVLNDQTTVRDLLVAGEDPNQCSYDGEPVLAWAASREDSACVRLLLDAGAAVDALGPRGYTPLMRAALENRAQSAALLRAAGAAYRIIEAAALGDSGFLGNCLDRGDDPETRNSAGLTPLLAASHAGHAKCIRLLAQHGADIEATTPFGHSALALATARGRCAAVRCLLDLGADISRRMSFPSIKLEGVPLSSEAARSTDPGRILPLLIAHGLDILAADSQGNTALHGAIVHVRHRQSGAAVVRLLLGYGADPNRRTSDGKTPLHHAMVGASTKSTRLLLGAGADPNARDNGGWTPLTLAAAAGKEAQVRALLDGGADPSLTDSRCEPIVAATPRIRALLRRHGWRDPMEELLEPFRRRKQP